MTKFENLDIHDSDICMQSITNGSTQEHTIGGAKAEEACDKYCVHVSNKKPLSKSVLINGIKLKMEQFLHACNQDTRNKSRNEY